MKTLSYGKLKRDMYFRKTYSLILKILRKEKFEMWFINYIIGDNNITNSAKVTYM